MPRRDREVCVQSLHAGSCTNRATASAGELTIEVASAAVASSSSCSFPSSFPSSSFFLFLTSAICFSQSVFKGLVEKLLNERSLEKSFRMLQMVLDEKFSRKVF